MKNNISKLTILSVIATLFLAPTYLIRFTVAGVPTTVLEGLIVFVFALWVVQKFVLRTRLVCPPRMVLLPLSLIVIGFLVGTIISVDQISALGYLKAYAIEPLLFAYIVYDVITHHPTITLFRQNYKISNLLWQALYLQAVLLAVLGLLQLFVPSFVVTADQAGRSHGVFNTANALTFVIGPILAVRIFSYVTRSSRVSWQTILDGILLAAFLGTQSLGGVLGLVGVFVTIVFYQRIPRLGYCVAILAYTCTVAFLVAVPFIAPETDNPWVRTSSTARIRICLWEGTLNLIFDHPINGAGLRSFSDMYGKHYVTCDAEPLLYPHNIFLNFWVEIGVVGLLGFMIFFFRVFAQPFTLYSGAFLYLYLHGLVDVPYFKNDLAVIFWILSVLWLATTHVQKTNEATE